jgi:hypothetical protein
MATPDTKSSLTVYKSITYKGSTRQWANRYHTNGPLTLTLAEFETLADAVVADEAAAVSDICVIDRATWSDASTATGTNPHGNTVYDKSYSTACTLAASGTVQVPGDCASYIRYSTDARSEKNHPIYLFNFYHGVRYDSGSAHDVLAAAWVTAMQEYGDDWLAGFSDGTNVHVRCGPRGAVAQARSVPEYITHRDFPT